ncbi:MAG: glycosyl transferase family 1 [Desulfobulbaceae bacterium BRH_c16a]|nr:MAG: glycosyl transferase family 1 [Desulfobulbaceae bacterium BRH_c16a]
MAERGEQMKKIWMLSREYGEIAGAGGVKDVVCQLAEALARWSGRSVHVVLPLYGFINAEKHGFKPLPDPFCHGRELCLQIEMNEPDRYVAEEVRYYKHVMNKVHVYLVDAERYRQKTDVYTYSEEDENKIPWQKRATGHHDYFAMNLLLQKAALELMIVLGEKPDIIHCHDGHTAVLPALIRENAGYRSYFRETGCLVTIHNAGYGYHQEIFDIPYAVSITALPLHIIEDNQLDKKFDPFLVAGNYAIVNTVSENYARELQETESDRLTGWLGHELLKRNVVLEGVTNGIEPSSFKSAMIAGDDRSMLFDPGVGEDTLAGKTRCKESLLEQLAEDALFPNVRCFGRLENNALKPLFTFIGRLSEQKGVDILIEVLEVFLARNPRVQMVVLGTGGSDIDDRLIQLTGDRLQGRMCFLQGYSTDLANKVFAAGDFFVVPSRYEPCGLTDFIAQLFGNIPVVHSVGGLVKVIDGMTGLAYKEDSPDDLLRALERALAVYDDQELKRKIQFQAVKEIEDNYTWSKVKEKYLDLYKKARNSQLCRDIVGMHGK